MTLRIKLLLPLLTASLTLTACGGSGSDTVDQALNDINDKYKNIEDDIRESYQKVEDKLTDPEKSTAEILKGIFLPEESLDNFLDKLTPEGGKGGLYVGHFIEDSDGDSSDVDIGAAYFDIGNDYAESVYGQLSYQQLSCQNGNTLETNNTTFKTDKAIGGLLSGTLDPAAVLDKDVLNYLKFDALKTSVTAMPFNGQYNEGLDTWGGQYSYQMGIGLGKQLSSNIDNCSVKYTLGNDGDFHVYPLTYKLGTLNPTINGVGSTMSLSWTAQTNTAYTLVSQIDVDKATDRGAGYVRNNLLKQGSPTVFSPVVGATKANYAFVVQAFNSNDELIAYQAIIQDL